MPIHSAGLRFEREDVPLRVVADPLPGRGLWSLWQGWVARSVLNAVTPSLLPSVNHVTQDGSGNRECYKHYHGSVEHAAYPIGPIPPFGEPHPSRALMPRSSRIGWATPPPP